MNLCFKYNNYSDKIEPNYFLKKHRIGKYSKEVDKIDKIIFVNKYSVNDKKLTFTNKLERKNSSRNNKLKRVIKDLMENPNLFNELFEGNDITNKENSNDKWKLTRLDKILRLYDNIPNNQLIFKYAPTSKYYKMYNDGNYERGFELFFAHEGNEIKIYLIDLYHLGIPSLNQEYRLDYVKRENYHHDISECLFELEQEPV